MKLKRTAAKRRKHINIDDEDRLSREERKQRGAGRQGVIGEGYLLRTLFELTLSIPWVLLSAGAHLTLIETPWNWRVGQKGQKGTRTLRKLKRKNSEKWRDARSPPSRDRTLILQTFIDKPWSGWRVDWKWTKNMCQPEWARTLRTRQVERLTSSTIKGRTIKLKNIHYWSQKVHGGQTAEGGGQCAYRTWEGKTERTDRLESAWKMNCRKRRRKKTTSRTNGIEVRKMVLTDSTRNKETENMAA